MIQLRIRTEYCFGQTYAPIPRLIERLKAIGATAAGIVDFNSTWGHVPWYNACKTAGIQPMLGLEMVVTDDETTRRMWFLAKDGPGLSELYRTASNAYRQPVATPFGHLPRLYRADVIAMSNGIFRFAGDYSDGEFLRDAKAFVDLNPASVTLNFAKRKAAEAYGLHLVSTGDNAYAAPEDKTAFEVLSDRGLKITPQHILTELDHQDVAEAIAEAIAEASAGIQMPTAPMIRAEGNLEEICRAGIAFRKLEWNDVYEERLKYELELIHKKDFDSYFIVVADMVQYAKQHMLVGPSRGSSAGSLVCYLARITEIDPIPPKLMFERFIDITRKDLPDIDLDFPDNKRQLVFDYMATKYGVQNIAHIGTISRYKPKSALIQTCKALGIPPQASGAVKAAMIHRGIADARASQCLEDTLRDTEAGKKFTKLFPEALIAMKLEGHASHTGVHAAGLLVGIDRIDNYCTVTDHGIAQIDKYSAEKLGLLKIDILGLRTLAILEDSGIDIDWYNLPFDDPATYEILNQQRMCGIFQFEGEAMRSLSTQLKFKTIAEIDAITALARPGPFGSGIVQTFVRRANGEPYKSIHPTVHKIMGDTFDLPLYQEQTMAMVREIGGFSWEETSFVRKAISKSYGDEMFQRMFGDKFLAGAKQTGIPDGLAVEIWKMIATMGSWQMNKSHTYSYAVISYWCAYLKAHYPLEFAAANLRNAKDEDSAVELLREIVREGVEYVPFDIQASELNWSVKNGKLIGGFIALKGIGESKGAKLIAARNAGTLTEKQIEDVQTASNVFKDIFPIRARYQNMYDDSNGNKIANDLTYIIDIHEGIPPGHERVFIGELIRKNPRSANEEMYVKERGGKLETGQTEYLDVRLRDDTGMIGGRIGRKQYLQRVKGCVPGEEVQLGKYLLDNIPVGAHLLIRARFYNGYRFAFIQKWRRLDV